MNDCRSVFITRHGGPDVLELRSTSISDPKEDEVLVEIKYSGINFADIMSRMGLYTTRLKHRIKIVVTKNHSYLSLMING